MDHLRDAGLIIAICSGTGGLVFGYFAFRRGGNAEQRANQTHALSLELRDVEWAVSSDERELRLHVRNVGTTPAVGAQFHVEVDGQTVPEEPARDLPRGASLDVEIADFVQKAREVYDRAHRNTTRAYYGPVDIGVAVRITWRSELGSPDSAVFQLRLPLDAPPSRRPPGPVTGPRAVGQRSPNRTPLRAAAVAAGA